MTVGKYEYSEEPHIITRTEIGDVEFNNTVLKIASQAARKGESIIKDWKAPKQPSEWDNGIYHLFKTNKISLSTNYGIAKLNIGCNYLSRRNPEPRIWNHG
jgi:hypothetical protein